MSEMIERVAQAICGDDNPANILTVHRMRARAAIEAMRDPTQEMKKAGCKEPIYHCWGNKGEFTDDESAGDIFTLMIDAALK